MTDKTTSFRFLTNKALFIGAFSLVMTFLFLTKVPAARPADLPTQETCRQVLKQVLEQDDFGHKDTIYIWERIRKKKSDSWFARYLKGLKMLLGSIRDAMKKWAGPMATVFEVLMWMLLGGGGAWFIYRYTNIRRLFTGTLPGPGRAKQPVPVLFGMAVTPESLPADIVGECRKLLDEGKQRQALALLYRGTLSRLLNVDGLAVPACATEMECDRLVAAHRPVKEAAFFSGLTACWLDTAYGHDHPGPNTIGVLAERWYQLYDKRRSD